MNKENQNEFDPSKVEGSTCNNASQEKQGEGKITVGELIDRLKPYPVMESLILDSLTDEEWETYVNSSKPAENPNN